MRLTRLIAAAALPGLIAAPAMAANPAASLSLGGAAVQSEPPAPVPPAAPASGGGISRPFLIFGGLALILVIAGAVALGSGNHTPASP